MTASTYGQRIRAARKAAGWTQEQLAEASGLHKLTISNLEREFYVPAVGSVVAIATALGVSTDQLHGLEPAGKGAA